MSFEIIATPPFEKELKQLQRKYPSLKKDYESFLDSVEANPAQGTSLGKDCFKIRLIIKSKGKGKRGGARIITCVKVVRETVYLLSIYDKSEKVDLEHGELEKLLKQINN